MKSVVAGCFGVVSFIQYPLIQRVPAGQGGRDTPHRSPVLANPSVGPPRKYRFAHRIAPTIRSIPVRRKDNVVLRAISIHRSGNKPSTH